ncbi:unnamed protein product [Somion occarium]|uniref:DH domain-containing protein n=2 Tax=Somion occarium TaxID=3059160 RepID=A0ABP1CZV5_9APHY
MALSHSPRKQVPLATGDEDRPTLKSRSIPNLTKRVFFCGVVVENPGHGRQLPQDVQDLVASLGEPIELDQDDSESASSLEASTDPSKADAPHTRRRALTNTSALADVTNEFVSTERSYVKRLYSLKHDYADPLRTFSRSKDTAIIPPYEAKTLFGNIDQLLPVNQAFLEDLERMMAPDGADTVGGIGDVALKHFKQLRGFENYKQYYSKREEAQAIFEKEMRKAGGFAAFIDRIKYSSTDVKNRVGLRELLMDPVQRIPRYTLMFRQMIKHMAPSDPQRAKLTEANEIASKIALAETDEQTKQATIMYCLSATIDEFPAWLMSHSRKFVDCIDVEDLVDSPYSSSYSHSRHGSASSGGPGGGSAGTGNLHCSLFLFDDKLMIVKRPAEKGARTLSGLNDLDKFTKSGLPSGLKKNGMACKGLVDVTDLVATDVGGADMHIYLESPPQDQTDRWSGRPFRALSVVHPPSPINLEPTRTESSKQRFLENLWAVQARYRTRLGQSVTLCAEEREVENRGGKITRARTYFNVYQRTAFLKEAKKTKIVLHIDPTGAADPVPFGMRAPPFVVVRVQPMAGELSRYTVCSNDPNDEDEEDIIQTARVPDRIVQTIHQFGLFKFRTGNISMPATPTASTRSRAAIFSLDTISRNLFNALPGSSKGDIFGGSINNHRRTKTMASRSSALTTNSSSSGDSGSLSRFSRTRSNSTATSVSMGDDDDRSLGTGSTNGKGRPRSMSRAKKLIKRPKSPGALSEPEVPSPGRSSSSRISRTQSESGHGMPNGDNYRRSGSVSTEGESEEEDDGDDDGERYMGRFGDHSGALDESERDLAARLELARRNSRNQHETTAGTLQLEGSVEGTIYEDDLLRSPSRQLRDLPDLPNDAESQHSTIRPDRPPSRGSHNSHTESVDTASTYRPSSRPMMRQSLDDRRPHGPRSPSPLPPTSPRLSSSTNLPPLDTDFTHGEDTLVNVQDTPNTPVTPRRNRAMSLDDHLSIPRTRRSFAPMSMSNTTDATPRPFKAAVDDISKGGQDSVEPLSIKKKPFSGLSSTRWEGSPAGKPNNAIPRTQPLHKMLPSTKTNGMREGTVSPTKGFRIPMSSNHAARLQDAEQLIEIAFSTKEDIESARRALKRIKLEADNLNGSAPGSPPSDIERGSSPTKGIRTPPQRPAPPLTREAQARMEEMRQLISKRNGETTPRSRPFSMISEGSLPKLSEATRSDDIGRNIEELASHADQELSRAVKDQEHVHTELRQLTDHLKETSADLERTRLELEGAKRQCEVVKSLLADATDEKEILYTAFNEELDGMYETANNLPPDDAWVVMTKDLRETKEARNTLAKENSQLKRRLAELELQNEEWGAMLRAYGLIS